MEFSIEHGLSFEELDQNHRVSIGAGRQFSAQCLPACSVEFF